jgi:hypothetical protein
MLAMVSWAHIGFLRRSMRLTHGKPVNLETLMLNLFKGQTMHDQFLDYAAALAIALALCIGLLDYFDVLVK